MQILRVFRAYAIFVRLAYMSAVAAALLLGVWSLASIATAREPGSFLRHISLGELAWYGLFITSVSCGMRAMFRPLRRMPLLPESHLRERPVVGTLVALAAAFAGFLAFNVALGLIQTLPNGSDANFAGPTVLAFFLYTFALLTGEIVLVGRTSRHQLRSVPVS